MCIYYVWHYITYMWTTRKIGMEFLKEFRCSQKDRGGNEPYKNLLKISDGYMCVRSRKGSTVMRMPYYYKYYALYIHFMRRRRTTSNSWMYGERLNKYDIFEILCEYAYAIITGSSNLVHLRNLSRLHWNHNATSL